MMSACIRADRLTLDFPLFLQRERSGSGWKDLFLGAAFDPPRRPLTRLLDDVSFEIGERHRLAFLSRNVAGKSTLLPVLNPLYPPPLSLLYFSVSSQPLLKIA